MCWKSSLQFFLKNHFWRFPAAQGQKYFYIKPCAPILPISSLLGWLDLSHQNQSIGGGSFFRLGATFSVQIAPKMPPNSPKNQYNAQQSAAKFSLIYQRIIALDKIIFRKRRLWRLSSKKRVKIRFSVTFWTTLDPSACGLNARGGKNIPKESRTCWLIAGTKTKWQARCPEPTGHFENDQPGCVFAVHTLRFASDNTRS